MRFPRIVGSLLSFACFLVALLFCIAEIVAIGPRSLMQEFAVGAEMPYHQSWEAAYKTLSISSSIKPNDAELAFDMARISWWDAQDETDSRREAYLGRARKHLEKAVSQRPSWGRAWIELANVYLQSDQPFEAKKSLVAGIKYVPYEGHSQWMAMWTAFAVWDLLDWSEKQLVMKVVEHVLEYGVGAWVIDPAVHYGRESLIIDMIPPQSRSQRRLHYQLGRRGSTN